MQREELYLSIVNFCCTILDQRNGLPAPATSLARAVIRRLLWFGLGIGCLLLPVLLLVLIAGLNFWLAEPSQNLIRVE